MKLYMLVLPLVLLVCSLVHVGSIGANSLAGQPLELGISVEDSSILESVGDLFGFTSQEISLFFGITKLGLGLAETIAKLFDKNFNGTDFSQFNYPGGDKKLLAMYRLLTQQLNQIQIEVGDTQANIRDLTRSLPQMVRWEVALDTLSEYATPINTLYHKFTYYQLHKDDIEEHTLLDFAKSVVSHDTLSVASLMGHIHSMIAPDAPPVVQDFKTLANQEYEVINNEVTTKMSVKLKQQALIRNKGTLPTTSTLGNLRFRPSLFNMLQDSLTNYSICSMNQTPQGMVFGFYALLSLTQAAGFAMTEFAWSILRFYNEGDFSVEQRLSEDLYNHYSKALREKTLVALSQVSNKYRRCEPRQHKEGVTYEAMTELLQGYIENEADLNPGGTCVNTCSEYEHVDVAGCYMPDTSYCGKHRRCKGAVHNCKFMDSDAWVCISQERGRRYDWIRYENMQVLGRENSCPKTLMKVDSWWRWFVHCSYCMCLCDDDKSPTSDRFVSLMPSVSDVADNKVVTGVRFIKKNRVMHVQVEEGKMLPQGLVSQKTVRWATLEPISVDDSSYISGTHFATLKYEMRNIDLDTLEAPSGYVVTGLKFRTLGNHINLEMWITPFNFTTGKLEATMSYWVSNDATPISLVPRKEIQLFETDSPIRAPGTQLIDSHNGTFIQMQATSMYRDVSQQTVPFFDRQAVVTSPPSPLQGVTLHHKGQKGYGGFFAFETMSFNLTSQFMAAA